MTMIRRLAPLSLIAALALTYFGALVVHPSHTLYADHSDLIALHVPWETFLARAWRESGELPLWNPLQFAGLPFVHDVQAAISYPPHWIFRGIGDSGVGPALSWLIVAHVILAGWGMFAYARTTGLAPTAAIVSALGFMFAGKWQLHLTLAGHYAFVGLAWLPWALLGLDSALRNRSLGAATWAGVAFGMLALSTHPQVTIYSGMFLVAWTFPFVLDAGIQGVSRRLAVWAGLGIVSAGVALAIASIQLLPSYESAALASRGVTRIPESPSLSLRTLLRTFGPSPDGVQPVTSWEPRSGLGVVWIAVALIAPIVTTGPARRRAVWGLGIVLALSIFALGGAVVFQALPLFRMFRQPARMFLVAALPVADLAGLVTQALLDRPALSVDARMKARRTFLRASIVMIVVLAIAALTTKVDSLRPHPYWFSLLVTVPLAWWLVGADPLRFGLPRRAAWVGLLLVDFIAQTYNHLQTCKISDFLAPSTVARFVAEHAGPLDRVLDRSLPNHQSSTPLGPALATNLGLHQVRGYNPLDVHRYKEYLDLISNPVKIRHPYNGLTNAPIFHKSLLDLLGVRFLVEPTDPALRSTPGEPNPDLDPRWRKVLDDPSPSAFTFAIGGVRTLPPYEVLENLDAFPRAFVVPTVAPLPEDRSELVRAMLTTDFRRVALVESAEPLEAGVGQGGFRRASIHFYQPNRIEIEAEGPGLLVLTDPWYPGWLATRDGQPTPIHRVDYLFRGVPLSSGHHTVTFTFQPRSYTLGRLISGSAWITVLVITAIGFVRRRASHAPKLMGLNAAIGQR